MSTSVTVLLSLLAGGAGWWGSGKIANMFGWKRGDKKTRVRRFLTRFALTALCVFAPLGALGVAGLPVGNSLINGKGTFMERMRELFRPEKGSLIDRVRGLFGRDRNSSELERRVIEGDKAWMQAAKEYGVDAASRKKALLGLDELMEKKITEKNEYLSKGGNPELFPGEKELEHLISLRSTIVSGQVASATMSNKGRIASLVENYRPSTSRKGEKSESRPTCENAGNAKKMMEKFMRKQAVRAVRKAVLKF